MKEIVLSCSKMHTMFGEIRAKVGTLIVADADTQEKLFSAGK